ncbi:PucR family transcriptional regulator, partial [Mycobacterium interjectum]|nr:PucR family transcriptional regulator [Mycobacterium interjectum]
MADVTSEIHRALEAQIPDLPREARIMELLGASVEGNVDTMLHA